MISRRAFNGSVTGILAGAASLGSGTANSDTLALRGAGGPSLPSSADLCFLSAFRQRMGLQSRLFTSVQLTQAYLNRIARFDAELVGFVHLDAQGALAAARDADVRMNRGERTPLLGIPVGIKDLIDVRGMPTTYGSRAFEGNIANRDAPAVARLRQAGAVILGKTNTTEFALGSPNTIKGASKNTWDLNRTAGGSSNGSGTAISAALCSVAIGTDTAGSIRTPSAFNGVYGLKPTLGRVSAEGVGVLSKFMDTVGPMTRSVEDIGLVMQVIAGHEPKDQTSVDKPVPDFAARLLQPTEGRLRIGVPAEFVTRDIDPEVRAAWSSAISTLARQGARVSGVVLPDLSNTFRTWGAMCAGDATLWHRKSLAERGGLYSEGARLTLQQFAGVSAADGAAARQEQWSLTLGILDAMEDVDVLILPATPSPAPTMQELLSGRIVPNTNTAPESIPLFAMPFNITGQPSLSIPVAMSVKGVPIAVQIVGRHFDEVSVLRAAFFLQTSLRLNLRPPRYAS